MPGPTDVIVNAIYMGMFIITLILFLITAAMIKSFLKSAIIWGVIWAGIFIWYNYQQKQYKIARHKENEQWEKEYAAYKAKTLPYLKTRCEKAGTFIYDENISPQDSVLIMTPDMFENSFQRLNLVRGAKGVTTYYSSYRAFPYLELTLPPITNEQTPKFQKLEYKYISERDNEDIKTDIDKPSSRYGVKLEEITTPDDKEYKVKGERIQIVELATNKVVAETIAYKSTGITDRSDWQEWRLCGLDSSLLVDLPLKVLRNEEVLAKNYQKEHDIFVNEAKPYFEEHCRSAGTFVYDENIPPQDGFMIIAKRVDSKLPIDFDQLLREIAFPPSEKNNGFSYQDDYYKFTYVDESQFFKNQNPTEIERIKRKRSGISSDNGLLKEQKSLYAIIFEDITSEKDRAYFIKARKNQIIELASKKAVAEFINFHQTKIPEKLGDEGKREEMQFCIPDEKKEVGKLLLKVLRNPDLLKN